MVIDSVTLSTTAAKLGTLSAKVATAPIACQVSLQADAGNAAAIYVGNSDVTTSKGWALTAGKELQVLCEETADIQPQNLYVVAASGTPRLNILIQEQ